jgi:hypothetical protein
LPTLKSSVSGGQEKALITLKDGAEDAATDVLARLYPQFHVADSANWPTVWEKAKDGNPGALAVVNHQGDPHKHAVTARHSLTGLVQPRSRHMQRLGKRVHTEAQRGQEILPQDLAGMAGRMPLTDYLRFFQDDDSTWRPAAGTFDGWPRHAAEIRFLDPCMGSGHFLVFALPILARLRIEEEGLAAAEAVFLTQVEGITAQADDGADHFDDQGRGDGDVDD